MYYDIKFYPKDNMIIFTIHKDVWKAKSVTFQNISHRVKIIRFYLIPLNVGIVIIIITILCIT